MKKRLLAFLLVALMLVSLLPVTAFAGTTGISPDEGHDLIVMAGDEKATLGADYAWDTSDSNKLIIKSPGMTVMGTTTKEYIDVKEDITSLTIKNLSITVTGQYGITFNGSGVTLTLVGDNTVSSNKMHTIGFGAGSNKITGAGDLTVLNSDYSSIAFGNGSLLLDCSGTIKADGNSYGIYSSAGTLSVSANTGKVLVYGFSEAPLWLGGMTVDPSLVMTGAMAYRAAEDAITEAAAFDSVNWIVKTESGAVRSVLIVESGEAAECTYKQKVTTFESDKTYDLKLSGKDVGEFTFAKSGNGWSIKEAKEDGKFLTMKDGKLALSGTAFAWTYKNGAFSTAVKTEQKNDGYWLGWIYVSGRGSKTVTTTYYLSTVKDGAKLSTSAVKAEFYKTVSSTHDKVYIDLKNGKHKIVCANCDKTLVEKQDHSYTEKNGTECKCGAVDPKKSSVKISVVDVKEKTNKQYVGFWPFGYYKNVKTYSANIKTEAAGVKVTKVQYQLNGSSKWITGTSVCSDKPIKTLNIRALGSNGKWYTDEYPKAEEPVFKTIAEIIATNAFFPVTTDLSTPPANTVWGSENGCVCLVVADVLVFMNISPIMEEDDLSLEAVAEKKGDTFVYTNPETGVTYTFNMKDGALDSITVANEPITPTDLSILNGTYTSPKTIADILELLEDGAFPIGETEDVAPEGAWTDGDGKFCYYWDDGVTFWNEYGFITTMALCPVTASGDNWTFPVFDLDKTGTATFIMKDGVPVAIEVTGTNEFNGTYAPAAPAGTISTVGDVLATVDFEDYASGAYYWENGTNTLRLYCASGLLYVIDNGESNYDCVSTDGGVELEGSNYICSGSFGTFSFNMEGGSLKSVTFTHSEGNEGYATLDGTYSLIL